MNYFKRYIVFDLETGGKNPKNDAITEIAMIAIDSETESEVDRYESLIKPYDAIYTEEAETISGIPFSLLEKEGKDIETVFEEILDFLDKHKIGSSKPVMVGHNIDAFDMDFLKYQMFDRFKKKMSRYINCSEEKVPLDDLEEKILDAIDLENIDEKIKEKLIKKIRRTIKSTKVSSVHYNTFDTLKMSRHFITNTERHTLGLSCGARGIVIEEAHRAMPDTEANAKLLLKLLLAGRKDNSIDNEVKKKRIDFYM